MSLARSELQKMLELVLDTTHDEIDCDGCLMQVGEFAERHLVGKPIPEGLQAVEQHLAICGECREEYELLRLALNSIEES